MLKYVLIIVSLLLSPPLLAEVGTYDSVRELFSKDFWAKKSTKKRVIDKEKIPIVRDFMRMCLKPSLSQNTTLNAIVKNHFGSSLKEVRDTKQRCNAISERYIEDKVFRAIRISGKKITDITPLQYLVQVDKLSLRNNNISDISYLSKLINLKDISLSNNPIKDISALKKLKQLEKLSIYNDSVIDISPLAQIKSLKSLSLASNNKNKEVLKNLTNLETLSIDGVTNNICYISKLKNLKSLYLSHTETKDISCLSPLKKLKSFKLSNLPVKDISVISNFTNLEDIQIKEAPVEDISVLKALKHLRSVRITHTKITDASPISSKQLDNFDAYKSPLRWCSPKTWEDVIEGVSCYEKDGTEKSWWKRLLRM